MADNDVRLCRSCGRVAVEDGQVMVEPTRCPHCGAWWEGKGGEDGTD